LAPEHLPVTAQDRLFFVAVPAALPASGNVAGPRSKRPGDRETTWIGDDANTVLRQLLGVSAPRETVELFPGGWPDSCWPLVLFGPAQSGKTSLARTILAGLERSAAQGRRIIGLTAPDLIRQVAGAIDSQTTAHLRDRWLQSAAVWIDDLHRLDASLATQEWLLPVLDRLADERVPLVATANGHLARLEGLVPALVSRLTGGLAVPVQLPGFAARCELLGRAARRQRLALSLNAIELIAGRFPVSADKLGRIINLVAAQPAIVSGEPDPVRIVSLLGEQAGISPEFSRRLVKLVASQMGLTSADVLGSSRQQTTVLVRGMLIYLLRETAGWSFSAIGRLLRGKDHSTVLHANRKIARRIETDAGFASEMRSLAARTAELMIDCLPDRIAVVTSRDSALGKSVDEPLLAVAGEALP
jgi:chromosomal replication initiator protein